MIELTLPFEWNLTKDVNISETTSELNDGYELIKTFGTSNRVENWSINSTLLSRIEKDSYLNQLKLFQGSTTFDFRGKIFRCEKWRVTRYDQDETFRISGTLERVFTDGCVGFVSENIQVSDINNFISGALTFLQNYSGISVEPFIANSQYGLKNSFHRVLGRGGYFYPTSGTSEGQFLIVRACLEAYKVTDNIAWKNLALNFASYLQIMYGGITPPTNPSTLYLPHWLFNVGESFPTKEPVAPKYINSGVFELPVTFTSGVGQIASGSPNFGERLSDVAIVGSNDSQLLWKNIFSELISGTKYSINYWVVNLYLGGTNYRVTPSGNLTATSEPAGKIVLNSTFSGTAKVTFLRYSPTLTIGTNELYDAYPLWRELDSGESNVAMDSLFWAYNAYALLYENTNNSAWLNAFNGNKYTLQITSQIINLSKWYRKSDNPEPIDYPGSQIVQVNNPNGYAISRVTSGTFKDFIQINSNAQLTGYPSIELQNYAVVIDINWSNTIEIEAGINTPGILQLVLSLSNNAFDQTKLYIYNLKIPTANTLVSMQVKPQDFVRWNKNYLSWYPLSTDDDIYTYQGSSDTSTKETIHQTIGNLNPLVYKITFNKTVSGYAGAGLIFDGKLTPNPPRLYFKSSQSFILRVRDSANIDWDCVVAITSNWTKRSFQWSDFTFSNQNSVPNPGSPNGTGNITAVEFIANVDGFTDIFVYWASISDRQDPEILENNALVYKGSVKSSIKNSHSIYIGNFGVTGSISNALKYNPGVVPFTTNTINGNVDSWRGIPYTGYQDSAVWFQMGLYDRAENVLDFCLDSQKFYKNSTGISGGFAPTYSWNYWDSGDYAINGINAFGWSGADPNTSWEGYQYRILEAIAKHWYLEPSNKKAERIVMSFLNFLDAHYIQNDTNQPPTDYPEGIYPLTNYHTPHGAALILRAAIYANLAGGNVGSTFRVIYKNWEYLSSQYVSSGLMNGSFSANQPNFTVGSNTYKEYFGFWHGEILIALSLLKDKLNAIKIPSCESIF